MFQIKKIDVVSLAKILGVIYALFGFVVGCLVVISKMFNIEAGAELAELQQVGYAAIIVFPIIYTIIGALSGVVTAFFFNLAANWVGALKVEIYQDKE